MGKPEVLDEFDSEKWAALYSDMLGVDPVLVVGGVAAETISALRLSRSQARRSSRPMRVRQVLLRCSSLSSRQVRLARRLGSGGSR